MRKTFFTLFAIVMAAFSSVPVQAQDRPNRWDLMDQLDQGHWLSLEARFSNGQGWNGLSDENKAYLIGLYEKLEVAYKMYGKHKGIETHRSSPSASPVSSEWLAQNLKVTEDYLALPFSEMSGDYLAKLTQLYTPLTGQPGVEECLKKIEMCKRCFDLYVKMEKSMKAPYDKKLVPNLIKDITSVWDNMTRAQKEEVQETFTYLNAYESAIRLFQDLIRAINSNANLKEYRREGESYNKESALTEIHALFNTFDNKAIGTDRGQNNFQRYISHIEWLNKKFEEYKNTLERDPLHRVLPLEDEILVIKLK